jgi:hypothetical protein
MSKESISTLLQARGSFPDEPDVRANFEALFAMARGRQESTADLAWGFEQALDQWSHVDARLDPAIAGPLREWAMAQWQTTPYELCSQLCILLVNVGTPQTLRFLADARTQAADPDLQRLIDRFIAMHPGAEPPAG